MYKKIITAILAMTAAAATATAQNQFMDCGKAIPASQVAFTAGERLMYAVSYKGAIFNTDIADITFNTTNEIYAGEDCYKIYALGKTRPFYGFFFTMEDAYTTWIKTSDLRPIKAISRLKEGDFRYRSSMDFVWAHKKVHTEGQNLRRNDGQRRTLNLKDCSYDALALFFNVRCADLTNVVVGESQSLNLLLEDTVRTIRFRFIGREKRDVSNLGQFSTLKFACQFATSSDESFKDGVEFFIWLSDDQNHIPVYLESPIKVGKVYATITQWSGLKHTLTSFSAKK